MTAVLFLIHGGSFGPCSRMNHSSGAYSDRCYFPLKYDPFLLSHSGSPHTPPLILVRSLLPISNPFMSAPESPIALDNSLATYRSYEYPKEMWYFNASFIVLVALCQFLSFLHTKISSPTITLSKSHSGNPSHVYSYPTNFFIRLSVALVNVFRVMAFRKTIKYGNYSLNLAEVAITIAYITALFLWALINSTSKITGEISVIYWANRAGVLAASQVPLVAALGTKNNIISLFVGISYDRLNFVHRMIARTLFVLLWVHAGGKISQGGLIFIQFPWLRLAFVALTALTLLMIVSLRPIRTNSYELFFFAHITLVLIFLIGAYWHTSQLHYSVPIIVALVIWGTDRVIRMGRIVFSSGLFHNAKQGNNTLFSTRAEMVGTKLIRLVVPRPAHFSWKPGQTAYLTLPNVSRLPFEAHPFTIGSYDAPSTTGDSNTSASPAGVKELVFLINVRSGMTKRLKEAVVAKRPLSVLVDGPYGDAHDLNCFHSCTLIAGGSGVSYTLPVLLDIIQNVKTMKSYCTRVLFLWTVRSMDDISWADDTLSQALTQAPPNLNISVRIFVTGSRDRKLEWKKTSDSGLAAATLTPLSPTTTNQSTSSLINPLEDLQENGMMMREVGGTACTINVLPGRPDWALELGAEVEATKGRLSVSVCGSQSIARSVRETLCAPRGELGRVLRGGASVSLFMESFGFA